MNTVLILKDKLKCIWQYRSRIWARKALDEWCLLAKTLTHTDVNKFVNMLQRYSCGILNHCDYHIHTSKPEEVNNKIKVIKRRASGVLDERYFSLKIIQALQTNKKHPLLLTLGKLSDLSGDNTYDNFGTFLKII